MTMKVKKENLLNLIFIILIFKILLGLLIPDIILNLLIFMLWSILLLHIFSRILKKKELSILETMSIISMLYLSVNLVISFVLFEPVSSLVAIRNYLSLIFPIGLVLIINRMHLRSIEKHKRTVIKLVLFIILIAFIELILPYSIVEKFGSYVLHQKFNQDISNSAYIVRDLGFEYRRLGSIIFEPVTFSFLCMYLLFLLYNKKYNFTNLIVGFIHIASFGKASILVYWSSKLLSYSNIIIFVVIFLMPASGYFLYTYIISIPGLEFTSMGMHLLGFVNGVMEGIKKPFFGNGLGSAGFIAYMEAKKIAMLGNYFDTSWAAGISNGNESFVGVNFYQLGAVGYYIYILPFIYYYNYFTKNNMKLALAVLYTFFLSAILVETVSSLIIVYLFVLNLEILKKRNQYECINN